MALNLRARGLKLIRIYDNFKCIFNVAQLEPPFAPKKIIKMFMPTNTREFSFSQAVLCATASHASKMMQNRGSRREGGGLADIFHVFDSQFRLFSCLTIFMTRTNRPSSVVGFVSHSSYSCSPCHSPSPIALTGSALSSQIIFMTTHTVVPAARL